MSSGEHKIAFFSKGDDKFLKEIIDRLLNRFEIRKIVILSCKEYNLIDKWMDWADICWFEWCDDLVIYASKLELAKKRKIICRLHSYEAFTDYPSMVNWSNVNRLIFVSADIQKYTIDKFSINKAITDIISNGVNLEKWNFRERTSGYNVAYIGYINYKKGPMLLLHTFKSIYDKDKRYKLYLAGQYQDQRYLLYFNQMIKEFGLENNFFFEGWQSDINNWLEDKDYVICSSVLESQNMSIMQAMAKGIKPVIHNFAGAKEIYPDKYVWNTIDEAVSMVTSDNYTSSEYRAFIKNNYSFERQCSILERMLEELLRNPETPTAFTYREYWNRRLQFSFNIEGVGYMGLGQMFNEFLYRTRFTLVDSILNTMFGDISDLRFMELGPGTGIFTEYFRNKKARNYDAIDIAERSTTELGRKYPEYNFYQGDVSENGGYSGNYDLIFAADVLLCITDEKQYKKAIINIAKHLTNNGICLLLDPVSVINRKSQSPHMVIRDRGYIKKLCKEVGLELAEIFPVTYFMNFPFDRDLAGQNSAKALELFNTISEIFTGTSFGEEDKKCFGEFLLLKDRELIYKKGSGLSEKLLILKKTDNPKMLRFNISAIYDLLQSQADSIFDRLAQCRISQKDEFKKVDLLISSLNTEEPISFRYALERLNEFSSYQKADFDKFDFSGAHIVIGRRDKTISGVELIEFILGDDRDSKLILNNIWYNEIENGFILPDSMKDSSNSSKIQSLCEEILTYELDFHNNIGGFIYDSSLKEDISKNYLAYMWERGIPASEFLPLNTYMKIAERYIFAAQFINENSNVLEAPCGFGYGAAYISKKCHHVEAVDIAEENILFAKQAFRQSNISWKTGDVTKLWYDSELFDIYVSYEVFEHLPVEYAADHIREAYRVLKKSGKFIISTPNRQMRRNVNNPFHIKEYDFDEFKSALSGIFSSIDFFSVNRFKVEKGISDRALVMIAVCEK